ncbi:hypothetical protein GYMLUDRAFT_236685 [Collybiopsis luxurians FD-317 M1]|nr:hypothetical protein GYMLUDRAFT_236685 [Collybiopsis luxurians FD-317 M1]
MDELTRKIGIHDNGPTFDRLRHGDFASRLDPSLGDARIRLAECDRSISLMEEALHNLKSARTGFERSVDVALSLYAPIRRLPKDILVEIFMIYVKEFGYRNWFKAGSRTYSVTLTSKYRRSGTIPRIFSPNFDLSHICSFWRKVVVSNPTFWTALSLDLGVFDKHKKESSILSFLSEYLLLSMQAPLDLGLTLAKESNCSSQDRALALLLKQLERCERLALHLPKFDSISPLLSPLQSTDQPLTLSSLKYLALYMSRPSQRLLRLPPIFIQSPRLETLSAGRFELPWANLCKGDVLSLKQLDSVSLSGASLGQFLSRMPLLETCTLIETGTWQTLRLPLLTHLSVYGSFEMPGGAITIEAISSMLLRSKATLRSVKFNHIFARDVISFIDAHTSVTDVIVEGYWTREDRGQYPGDFLPRLTISKDDEEPILAPNLHSLNFRLFPGGGEGYPSLNIREDIIKMVQSRASVDSLPRGVAALRKVSTFLPDEPLEGLSYIRDRLAPLVKSGLQLDCS